MEHVTRGFSSFQTHSGRSAAGLRWKQYWVGRGRTKIATRSGLERVHEQQGHAEVRWRTGQESSLAPLSNLLGVN